LVTAIVTLASTAPAALYARTRTVSGARPVETVGAPVMAPE